VGNPGFHKKMVWEKGGAGLKDRGWAYYRGGILTQGVSGQKGGYTTRNSSLQSVSTGGEIIKETA